MTPVLRLKALIVQRIADEGVHQGCTMTMYSNTPPRFVHLYVLVYKAQLVVHLHACTDSP